MSTENLQIPDSVSTSKGIAKPSLAVRVSLEQEYLNYLLKDHKKPKPYSLQVFGKVFFSIYYHKRLGWLRLFGKGVKWKDTTIHPLLFSERSGYSKGVMIGNWRVSIFCSLRQ